MATQKPGEWANTLILRFEEQVRLFTLIMYLIYSKYNIYPPHNQYILYIYIGNMFIISFSILFKYYPQYIYLT